MVLLAVRGIRRSFLQHHISKASIFLRSATLIDQESHAYVAIGKIRVGTSLIFVLVVMLLSLHILFIAHMDIFAIAVLRLVSTEQLPWFDIMAREKFLFSGFLHE